MSPSHRTKIIVQIPTALKSESCIPSVVATQQTLDSKTNMVCQHNRSRGGAESHSPLIVNDLCAQLAPLNRYGLPGLSAVVANGARALIGASRTAVIAVVARNVAIAPHEGS
jgi:hypothetical protein